ncbi:DNA replication ATP-dependent helicase/nuclease DNA2 [Lutzomyia longipalpis]|uniref:DNA replication ATP-dependent helicase/nuclease DNA2 n=1 Tax=Lutzomyia longipalpis TaxID=7200 RepID=UPI002483E672|nr:DNA replication ATP-dependent helicase/nuclease DNA2 [Lutzomyia longipalpis]
MDPSKKRRLALTEDDTMSMELASYAWDDWEFEENKENISINTGARIPEQRQQPSAPLRTFDLTRWRRCEVKTMERTEEELRLGLMEDDVPAERAQTGMLILFDSWIYTDVHPFEIVSVKAIWSEERQCHIITMNDGLIVVNPNVLISGTTLLGSLFCSRRGILDTYFKKTTAEAEIMAVGTMVHELLQICLKNKLDTREQIMEACRNMLQNQRTIFTMYSACLKKGYAEKEMYDFVPKIHQFMQRYIHNRPTNMFSARDNFDGIITEVQDIEENIWMPQMGLKGKVDVSVRVRNRENRQVKTMPLELKTGRANFSLEHRGQLTIYQMMMSEVNPSTDSGLLLYLREGIMREVKPSWNEIRDLVMMRNKYVGYLACEKIYLDEGEAEFKLPRPIDHPSACAKCHMNTICCTFLLRSEQRDILSPGMALNTTLERVTAHLSDQHVEYFIDWVHIILYEYFHENETFTQERIWIKTPEVRENEGFTLAYLVIQTQPVLQGSRYVTEFQVDKTKTGGMRRDCLTAGFSAGDYLIVSTTRRIAVATGTVLSIESQSITLSLERDLQQHYSNEVFHIDRYESNMKMTFDLTNLGALLENTEKINSLRSLIVDRITPSFDTPTEGGERILHESFRSLNFDQMNAVLKFEHLKEYMLLEGLPGTGKTQTIVAIVRYYHCKGKSVLITSHTNAAVDNFLVRLIPYGVKFMRLGSTSRISPELRDYTEASLTQNCTTLDDLNEIYEQCSVVGVTCMGSNHPLLVQKEFDLCIVDEATQVFQPTVLRPLLAAKKFLLVGDPNQLPPLMKSDHAVDLGGGESLFKRLQGPLNTATLSIQYRMNATITDVANNLAYEGRLKCATSTVARSVIQYAQDVNFSEENCPNKWLYGILRTDLSGAFVLLDTGNTAKLNAEYSKQISIDPGSKIEKNFMIDVFPEEHQSGAHVSSNICEAAVCLYIVRAMTELGIQGRDIGIIAPFRAQVTLLQQLMGKFCEMFGMPEGVEVNTVDQYQGREKSVIIYSCVTNCNNTNHVCAVDERIMGSNERFAVALTRAKHKCIVIGNVASLAPIAPFKSLKQGMLPEGFFRLTDPDCDFDWAMVQQHLLEIHRKDFQLLLNPLFDAIPDIPPDFQFE